MVSLDAVISRLLDSRVAQADKIRGCSLDEVKSVEKWSRNKLPKAYEEFLLRMGRAAGLLFSGDDVFFNRLKGIREDAQAIADGMFVLPEDAVVFWMHQGYQFMYLRASEGDDPPVYYYLEGNDHATRDYEHFTELVLDSINEAERMEAALAHRRGGQRDE